MEELFRVPPAEPVEIKDDADDGKAEGEEEEDDELEEPEEENEHDEEEEEETLAQEDEKPSTESAAQPATPKPKYRSLLSKGPGILSPTRYKRYRVI